MHWPIFGAPGATRKLESPMNTNIEIIRSYFRKQSSYSFPKDFCFILCLWKLSIVSLSFVILDLNSYLIFKNWLVVMKNWGADELFTPSNWGRGMNSFSQALPFLWMLCSFSFYFPSHEWCMITFSFFLCILFVIGYFFFLFSCTHCTHGHSQYDNKSGLKLRNLNLYWNQIL